MCFKLIEAAEGSGEGSTRRELVVLVRAGAKFSMDGWSSGPIRRTSRDHRESPFHNS